MLDPQKHQLGDYSHVQIGLLCEHATFRNNAVSATAEKMDEWRQLFTSFCLVERLKVDDASGQVPGVQLTVYFTLVPGSYCYSPASFTSLEYSFSR